MALSLFPRRARALETLGLSPDAGREAIRRAFRRHALACHPDLHPGRPGLEERFRELAEAYHLALAEDETPAPPAPPRRGRDLSFRLALPFLQAALGGEALLRYPKPFPCPRCAGRGCRRCGGKGESLERARLRARVPAGVEEGEVLRLRAAGGLGAPGAAPGDLYLSVSIRPHPVFRRRGPDIHSEAAIPRARLWEGGTIRVGTLRGTRQVFLLPYTPEGKIVQLRGEGIRRERGGEAEAGDHFVRIAASPVPPAAMPSARGRR